MAPKKLPPRSYVRQCLTYDPKTGELRWRKRPLSHFPDRVTAQKWNTRWAGKIAGKNHARGYWMLTIDYQGHLAHRVAWLLAYGEPVPHMLDHIDGNRQNNRIANLRAATQSENNWNSRLRKNNLVGVKGIRRVPRSGKFSAEIWHHGRSHVIGYFVTLEEAMAARREAAERLHGKFARHE